MIPSCCRRRASLVALLCAVSFVPVWAAQLPRSIRQAVNGVDGTFTNQWSFGGSCPSDVVVSGATLNTGSTDVGTIGTISVDGVDCSGGTITVVTPEIASSREKLGEFDSAQLAVVESNGAAEQALFGGIDRATVSLGYSSSELTCGATKFPARTSFIFMLTGEGTQDIVFSNVAGADSETFSVPPNSQASFIAAPDVLCLNQDVASSARQDGTIAPVVVPVATPGEIASIFVDAPVPSAEESREIGTVDNTTGGNNGLNACFPGDSKAELEGGMLVRLDSIKAGDRVRTGADSFSEVYFFTHKEPIGHYEFVKIRAHSGHELRASAGHYIYASGALRPASQVRLGDELSLGSGETTTVAEVSEIVATGLFNPQTIQGDIVVDGVVSSTYTTAVEPRIAHASLLPARLLYAWTGFTTSKFDEGSEAIAGWLPGGTGSVV